MYAKIFTSLFDGSMRGHPDLILIFVNILCHANQDGIVDRHWKAIADETGLSVEKVKTTLIELESPDVESRSRNEDGRRIIRIDPERDWGWQIINFKHYREMRTAEERREYMRELMRKRRSVSKVLASVSMLAKTEAETNADSKKKNKGLEQPIKTSRRKFATITADQITPVMIRIGSWFRRRPSTLWSLEEFNALPPPENMPDDVMDLLEKYYTFKHPSGKDYRRRNIITMLNNWNAEIDKVTRWLAETGGKPRLSV